MKEKNSRIMQFMLEEKLKLYSYIRGKIQGISPMDVEDIIGDVILSIFVRSDISSYIENFAAYIYKSINNKIIDYVRNNKKHVSLEEEGISVLDIVPDAKSDIDDEIKRKEIKRRIYLALESLESKQKAVWIATEVEGRSFKELADLWNEPIGTLLSRKSRATKFLQNKLKDMKDDF
jgi:RNA polymerase sigma factor (sigma-70 family)